MGDFQRMVEEFYPTISSTDAAILKDCEGGSTFNELYGVFVDRIQNYSTYRNFQNYLWELIDLYWITVLGEGDEDFRGKEDDCVFLLTDKGRKVLQNYEAQNS